MKLLGARIPGFTTAKRFPTPPTVDAFAKVSAAGIASRGRNAFYAYRRCASMRRGWERRGVGIITRAVFRFVILPGFPDRPRIDPPPAIMEWGGGDSVFGRREGVVSVALSRVWFLPEFVTRCINYNKWIIPSMTERDRGKEGKEGERYYERFNWFMFFVTIISRYRNLRGSMWFIL